MAISKDLYEILGVSRDASDSEIKRAYKKLAVKWHPDRHGNDSEDEQKEAEEKFKELSFAYSILSDPEKKQKYDKYGITDDQQQMGGGFDASEIFKHFMSGFGGMFDGDDSPFGSFFGGGRRGQSNQPTKGQSIRMQIPVSIKEIMDGVDRDIKYDISVRCNKCNGTGGDGVESCPHCHGTGMITEVQRSAFGIIQNSHPCQYCNATGQIIKNKCSECHGTGFKQKETTVHVKIPGGFDNGHQVLLKGKGYEAKHVGHDNGDLLLEFIYNYDSSKYIIKDNVIYEFVSVPYYDCILGKEYEHTLANGDKVKINIPEYTQDRTVINTQKRYGINKYYLFIVVEMPKYLKEKEKELLRQIKNENG